MAKGIRTAINNGVEYDIAIIVVTKLVTPLKVAMIVILRLVSAVLISLLNLLRILPRGVVSKNDCGARSNRRRRLLWIILEAMVQAIAKDKVCTATETVVRIPIPAYTPTRIPGSVNDMFLKNDSIKLFLYSK